MTDYTKGEVKTDKVYLFNKWNVPKDDFIKFFKGGIKIDYEDMVELYAGGQEIDNESFNIFWKLKNGEDDGKIWDIKGNGEFAYMTSKWETDEDLELKDCDFIEVPTIIKNHIYNRLDEEPLYKLKEGEERIKVVDEEGNIDESKIKEIIDDLIVGDLDKRLDGRENELNKLTEEDLEFDENNQKQQLDRVLKNDK